MSTYKYLLFDLDDTLLDFKRSERWALEQLFQKNGLEFNPQTLATYMDINRDLWSRYEKGEISSQEITDTRFTSLFEHYQVKKDGLKAEQDFRNYLAEANFLMPQAKEVLENLANDYQLFALTNGIAQTQANRLKAADIDKYFQEVYVSGAIGSRKPEAAFFDFVFEDAKELKADQSLMIGDNLATDIIGAANYGLDTCWMNPYAKAISGNIQPTYQIQQLDQLYPIIGR